MASNITIVGEVLNTDIINRYPLQDERLLLPSVQQVSQVSQAVQAIPEEMVPELMAQLQEVGLLLNNVMPLIN